MHFISRTIAIVAALSVAACGENRQENPEFFEKKTGLPLCPSARVSNKTVGDHDFETDFTYSVDINMDRQCENQFILDIKDRLNIECDNLDNCRFMDSNSWSYEIRRTKRGSINFTLRVI